MKDSREDEVLVEKGEEHDVVTEKQRSQGSPRGP